MKALPALKVMAVGALGGAATMAGAYGASRYTARGWVTATTLAAAGGAAIALFGSHLRHQSITDDATTLYNRRYLFSRLAHEQRRAQRTRKPLAFLVAEVDNMRTYNNTYGHLAGDAVLAAVAHSLRDSVRRGDVVARWGGDEFGIVLPDTDLTAAAAIAQRLRFVIQELGVALPNGRSVGVTISVGVAANAGYHSHVQLIAAADEAMYIAKQHKNNVVVAQ